MFGADLDDAVLDREAGHAVEQRQVDVLPERQHQRIGLERLELAGRLREALVVERHLLDGQRAFARHVLDRRQPLDHHAFLQRLLDLEVVRGHLLARAAVDDDRLGGAEALRGARDVERGVAAAVDDHAPAQHRLVLPLHAAQHRHGVEHPRGLAGGDVRALGDVRADGEERGVEAARLHRLQDVRDLAVQRQLDAQVEDALHLGVEHVARQPVLRDAEAHHAAGERAGFDDRHAVAEAAQVIGGREPRRAGADDQHALAGFARRRRELPAALDRLVAEEALDRIDADRLVELAAVARALARVVADAPHDGGQRIVRGQRAPGGLVVAALGVVEPALDVLAGRAGVVAGRQPVEIDRPRRAPRAGLVGEARADVERDREGLVHGAPPSRAGRSWRCCDRRSPGSARGVPRPAPCRTGARSASAASGTRRPAPGGGSSCGPVISPSSASNSGKSPDSTAIRAILIVSAGAEPQPSGQGTWMWM